MGKTISLKKYKKYIMRGFYEHSAYRDIIRDYNAYKKAGGKLNLYQLKKLSKIRYKNLNSILNFTEKNK